METVPDHPKKENGATVVDKNKAARRPPSYVIDTCVNLCRIDIKVVMVHPGSTLRALIPLAADPSVC
jgi:hypothetical protein